MKVLVTGSTGFLGPSVVERLLAHGANDIRCFGRAGSNRSRMDILEKRYPAARLESFTGSLATPEAAAKALEGVDTVFHLAAGMKGAPADLCLNTVVTSKNLLEAMVGGRAVKIVLVSSFGVYGTAVLKRNAILNEETPLEPHPAKRDPYSFAKLRQEALFWEYSKKYNFPLVVLRPGVIYGPAGSEISSRIGLTLPGLFLSLGGRNSLPLSYVENCAEAIVAAGFYDGAAGQAFNVHDDDLPTCKEYLRQYRKNVRHLRSLSLPYWATMSLSRMIEKYHVRSRGQLPALLTPYRTATTWKGTRFDNSKLKGIGWRQLVSTDEGLRLTFDYFRTIQR